MVHHSAEGLSLDKCVFSVQLVVIKDLSHAQENADLK